MSKRRVDGILLDSANGNNPVKEPAQTTLVAPAATASTSTSPFGFSQAQADALITCVRAIVTALQANGTCL